MDALTFSRAPFKFIVLGGQVLNPDDTYETYAKYPKEKEVHYRLGLEYKSKRMLNEAIQAYSRALELDPNWGVVNNELSYVYGFIGDYEKAWEFAQKYASISSGDPNPFDSMGDLYLLMGRLDDAIHKYKEALDVSPNWTRSNWNLGYIYGLKENYTEMMKLTDRFIEGSHASGRKAEGL